MKNKKGFTLIELLAVIVILAIIALIAVPVIMNIINKANKSAFKDTAYGILNAGELYFSEQQLELNGMAEDEVMFELPLQANTETGIKIKGQAPNGKMKINKDGNIAIAVYNGRYCAKKEYEDKDITVTEDLANCWLGVPTIEELKERYEFKYYSSLMQAVNDVNNNEIGVNTDVNEQDAVAAIYTNEANEASVVLLKDTTETSKITVGAKMILNLGGHKLTSIADVGVDVTSGNLVIDGRIDGSTIETSNTNVATITVQTSQNTDLIVRGGTYEAESTGYSSVGFSISGTADISDSVINANETTKVALGVYVTDTGSVTVSNCDISSTSIEANTRAIANSGSATISDSDITATSTSGKAYGIYNIRTANISNSNITATSTDGGGFGVWSNVVATTTISDCDIIAMSTSGKAYGIQQHGTMKLKNCYVMGIHFGISNHGTLYVDGGTYEGYDNGGIYFSGTETTAYVANATIRECNMPEGYIATSQGNNAGFFIGGGSGFDNIKVYMDNCDIYGSVQPIVLRGSSGEKNNTLYISNSKINTDKKIRIDNETHKLYIGSGNNFTADNTGLPSAVVTTTDVYTRENFENK